MSHELVYQMNNGVVVNVTYGVVDDGEDIKILHIAAPSHPDVNIPVDDDEMEAISATALEDWFFK